MVALATLDDVEALTMTTIAVSNRGAVERVIEMASGMVVDFLGQQLLPMTGDTLTRPAPYGWTFELPERPVNAITSITVDGVLVDADSYIWETSGKVELRRWNWAQGFDDWPLRSWGGPNRTMVIVYDHGYNPMPDSVALVVAGMVAAHVTNPQGVRSETVGGESSSFFDRISGASSALALTDEQKRSLKQSFGRNAWSLDLGT